MNTPRSIDPIYIMHKDIKKCTVIKRIPITLCREINNIMPSSVRCVQQYYDVWCVYLDFTTNRNRLINIFQLTVYRYKVNIYDSNPFDRSNSTGEKILIKDLKYYIQYRELIH